MGPNWGLINRDLGTRVIIAQNTLSEIGVALTLSDVL